MEEFVDTEHILAADLIIFAIMLSRRLMSPEYRKIIDDAFLEAEKWWATSGLENDMKEIFETLKKKIK
jgi:hypothetical protein